MLNRKIDKYLIDYCQKSDNALLITGARQVGKTYSIREFGKGFKSFIEINFIENPDAVGLFKDAKGSTDILMRLSIITNVQMIKGDTLECVWNRSLGETLFPYHFPMRVNHLL